MSGRGGRICSAPPGHLSCAARRGAPLPPLLSPVARALTRARRPAAAPAPAAPHSSASRSRPRPSPIGRRGPSLTARLPRDWLLRGSRARAHTGAGGGAEVTGARRRSPLPARPGSRPASSRLAAAAARPAAPACGASSHSGAAACPPVTPLGSGPCPPAPGHSPSPSLRRSAGAGEGRREAEAAGERGSVRKEAGREGGGGGRAGEVRQAAIPLSSSRWRRRGGVCVRVCGAGGGGCARLARPRPRSWGRSGGGGQCAGEGEREGGRRAKGGGGPGRAALRCAAGAG